MVGGLVCEKITLAKHIWINTVDSNEERHDKCAIYVHRNADADKISVGDSLWWQGAFAMWTPHSRDRLDVKIPRWGFSGVSKPTSNSPSTEVTSSTPTELP